LLDNPKEREIALGIPRNGWDNDKMNPKEMGLKGIE